jgi:hypothetical protein
MTAFHLLEDQTAETAETVEVIGLDTVVEQAINEFDSVTAITIAHLLTWEQPRLLTIKIYTGEADSFEDHLQLFSDDHRIAIDRGDEPILVPFRLFASFDGPAVWDSVEQTTIYMQDNVFGAQPLQIGDGLAYIQNKLKHPEQWNQDSEYMTSLTRIRNYTE